MDDLISRQATIEALRRAEALTRAFGYHNVIETVMELPPVQPEIIRCKDCAKRECCRTSTVWAIPPKDDWYCADAER